MADEEIAVRIEKYQKDSNTIGEWLILSYVHKCDDVFNITSANDFFCRRTRIKLSVTTLTTT